MKISTETTINILKRIKDYCEHNDSCEGCPFLSLDEKTSSRLPHMTFCDLEFDLEPHYSRLPYQWPVEDWLLDDEDVDDEDESEEEEDDTVLPW